MRKIDEFGSKCSNSHGNEENIVEMFVKISKIVNIGIEIVQCWKNCSKIGELLKFLKNMFEVSFEIYFPDSTKLPTQSKEEFIEIWKKLHTLLYFQPICIKKIQLFLRFFMTLIKN